MLIQVGFSITLVSALELAWSANKRGHGTECQAESSLARFRSHLCVCLMAAVIIPGLSARFVKPSRRNWKIVVQYILASLSTLLASGFSTTLFRRPSTQPFHSVNSQENIGRTVDLFNNRQLYTTSLIRRSVSFAPSISSKDLADDELVDEYDQIVRRVE